MIEQMRFARNRLNFVILDACRNNPFARSFRSADRGLARMDAPAGVLIAYSTAPGDVAADGEGANSPYAEALAQVLREDGLPAELMFKRARDAVRRATGERQTPWESSSLTGDNFYFASAPRAAAGAAAPADGAAAAPLVGPATVPVATAPAVAAPAVAAPAATSPVVAATASTAPGASPAERPPEFMADELCRHAVGEWRLEDEAMPGTVRLDADATGTARVRPDHRAVVLPVQWECDAANRDFVITLGDRDVHKVRIDGEEKLMFGYDREGRPLSYVR
ncbi:MAG: caspase family protein [Steroidobacteraceae bacterium]